MTELTGFHAVDWHAGWQSSLLPISLGVGQSVTPQAALHWLHSDTRAADRGFLFVCLSVVEHLASSKTSALSNLMSNQVNSDTD